MNNNNYNNNNYNDFGLSQHSLDLIKKMMKIDEYFNSYDVFIASSKFNSIGADENNVKKFYTSVLFFYRKDRYIIDTPVFNLMGQFGFYNIVLFSVINDIYTP